MIETFGEISKANHLTPISNNLFTGVYGDYHIELKIEREMVKFRAGKFPPWKVIPASEQKTIAEDLVKLLLSTEVVHGQFKVVEGGQAVLYRHLGYNNQKSYFQLVFNLLVKIAIGYRSVVALGGEIVPLLQTGLPNRFNQLRAVIIQLLEDIGGDTKSRLEERLSNLLCLHCLTRFCIHKVPHLPWTPITYCGCRICHQSRDFYEGQVEGILDEGETRVQFQQNGVITINWLLHRNLFDFDRIKIIRATDEDVERFAIQVSNDLDPVRREHNRQVPWIISPNCQLSENTIRVLHRLFDHVETENYGRKAS